jgi:regulatory protein
MEKMPRSLRSTERDESKQAFAAALRILTSHDLSVAELTARLKDKGVSDTLVKKTIVRLQDSGYLDDRKFARQWAESAIRNGRGYGVRLRLDLARRGVQDEIVNDLLATIAAEYDEMETLTALLSRKFAGFDQASASDREKRRVMQYLQRRGFSTAAIFNAFRINRTEDEEKQAED